MHAKVSLSFFFNKKNDTKERKKNEVMFVIYRKPLKMIITKIRRREN